MNKILITICILITTYTSAFGYSFQCDKYAKPSVVQSCKREEAKYYKECFGDEQCMRKAHRWMEESWAKYNLALKTDQQQTNGNGYHPAPQKYMSIEEKMKQQQEKENYLLSLKTKPYIENFITQMNGNYSQLHLDFQKLMYNNYQGVADHINSLVLKNHKNGAYDINSDLQYIYRDIMNNQNEIMTDCLRNVRPNTW